MAGAYRWATTSYRLVPSPEALFVLASVARAEKRELDAQDLMRRYLADPNLDAGSDGAEPGSSSIRADPRRSSS